jgi:hypothetical protein
VPPQIVDRYVEVLVDVFLTNCNGESWFKRRREHGRRGRVIAAKPAGASAYRAEGLARGEHAAEDERVRAAIRDYAVNEKTGKVDAVAVAKLLSRYEGRVFGGARVDKVGTSQGIARWSVTVEG